MLQRNPSLKIETLAWITDDEAEFWTSTSPIETKKKSKRSHAPKSPSVNDAPPNDPIAKENSRSAAAAKDNSAVPYKPSFVFETRETWGEGKVKQIEEKPLSDANSRVVRSHPADTFQRPAPSTKMSEENKLDDEVFAEIDENEIAAAANAYVDDDNWSLFGNLFSDDNELWDTIKSFFEEVTEETDVITGTIDHETLVNRRSRRAKFAMLSMNAG